MNTAILGFNEENLTSLDGDHKLLPEVASAFKNMRKAANESGIDITICSSYRSFEKQLSIWNLKFSGQLPLFTLNGNKLNPDALSDEDKIHAIMLWSALPGASRHHWGTDFDVYDKASVTKLKHKFQLVPEEYSGIGPCSKMCSWINAHAAEFGFYFPYSQYVGGVAAEPWHMSFQTIASKIEKQFSLELLKNALEQSNILGKEAVLQRLPELVQRYTFNQGVDSK